MFFATFGCAWNLHSSGQRAYSVSMKAVPVATFNETGPAQQLRDRLQRAGIQTRVNDESKLERFWFMSEPLAAFHVEVHQSDFLNARRLIHE